MQRAPPRLLRWAAAALLLAALAGCAAEDAADIAPEDRRSGPVGVPVGPWAQQDHFVPVPEPGGTMRLILARTCRPQGVAQGARRLVVINHGKPPTAARIAGQAQATCEAEAVRWFLARGDAVVLPLRRGYGASQGVVAEAYPPCTVPRDYTAGALEAARDMQATITYATALPGIAGREVVVVGQSAGGLGTAGLASLNDPRVAALVSMAGGDGGHLNGTPGAVCQSAALVRAMGRLGASAHTPMLWIYTANDSYFSPALAAAMHRAFVAAGGRAELQTLAAFGTDGHLLFWARGGAAVWGPPVARFLDRHAATRQHASRMEPQPPFP